jgi:hypothetical protein
MRPAISLAPETGTTRFQADDDINEELSPDISYHEALGCVRSDYERMDIKKSPVAKVAAPMAEVSWQQARSTADVLKDASELAFLMEARRRGYEVAGRILSGKYHDSGKRKHRRKNKSLKQG